MIWEASRELVDKTVMPIHDLVIRQNLSRHNHQTIDVNLVCGEQILNHFQTVKNLCVIFHTEQLGFDKKTNSFWKTGFPIWTGWIISAALAALVLAIKAWLSKFRIKSVTSC